MKIPGDQLAPLIHIARLGKGEAKELAEVYRSRLAANPFDSASVVLLADALAASGQADQIEPEIVAWENRVPIESRFPLVAIVRSFALYEAGKPQESLDLCLNNPPIRDSAIAAQSMLALGRTKEVADDPSFEKLRDDPWFSLSVSLGFALDGRADDAKTWRDRAVKSLGTHGAEWRKLGQLLASEVPVPVTDFDRFYVSPEDKALLFAAMAERFPTKRAEYRAAAARFNLQRKPPYLLIQRALASKPPASK